MSYTKHFTDTVRYSGYVNYTYPASENGGSGSAHYSGEIPITININVDTDPFERSVDGTNTALAGVSAVLAATEAAQVASIHESARKIANAATRGFFSVLSNELSARVSEFASSMRSSVGLLLQEAQAVDNVHRQMESDYHAIKSRYTKVFTELDRELDRRIRELDIDAFQLSNSSMREVVERPYTEIAGQIFTQTSDIHDVPLKLQCARTKERASSALDTMGTLCDYLTEYSSSMSQIMDDTSGRGVDFVPVVYSIQEDQSTGEQRIVVQTGDIPDEEQIRRGVISYVASRPDTSWTNLSPSHREALHNEFMQLVGSYASVTDPSAQEERGRICQTLLGLYRQAGTQTCYSNTSVAH